MNILYIGESVPNMIMEPIHLALAKVANVRTLWVQNPQLPVIKWPMKHFVSPIALTDEFLAEEPDLIFVAEIFRKIKGLERFHCPKAYYIQDPHINLKRYIEFAHLNDYDRIYVTQADYLNPLAALYGTSLRWGFDWLPPAFDPDYFNGDVLEKNIDVIFIGHKNADETRRKMIEAIGAQTPIAYQHNMGLVLKRSKIVFNRSRNGDLSPRVFEGMAAGALVVTDRISNGMFDLFKERVHLRTYADEKELVELVEFYLDNDSERISIAKHGMDEVMAKHTYVHRAKKILEFADMANR